MVTRSARTTRNGGGKAARPGRTRRPSPSRVEGTTTAWMADGVWTSPPDRPTGSGDFHPTRNRLRAVFHAGSIWVARGRNGVVRIPESPPPREPTPRGVDGGGSRSGSVAAGRVPARVKAAPCQSGRVLSPRATARSRVARRGWNHRIVGALVPVARGVAARLFYTSSCAVDSPPRWL
jgi:hypothetical protein